MSPMDVGASRTVVTDSRLNMSWAVDKGIKVVVANIGINADFQSTFIDSDNYGLGSGTAKYAVDFIKKNLGGKAKIATLAFESQIKELSNMRQSGFEDLVKNLS